MENNFDEKNLSLPQISSVFYPCYDYAPLPGDTTSGPNYPMLSYQGAISHREILKEKIRQEVYAELALERELEEKLRREILMERDFLVPKVMFPNHSYEPMPFQRDPRAMFLKAESSVPQHAMGILQILPPKPETSHGTIGFVNRERTQTSHVEEFAASSSTKTKNRGLSCALCQVTATSAQALDDHLKGKKHKAKAAKLKAKGKAKTKRGKHKNKRPRK